MLPFFPLATGPGSCGPEPTETRASCVGITGIKRTPIVFGGKDANGYATRIVVLVGNNTFAGSGLPGVPAAPQQQAGAQPGAPGAGPAPGAVPGLPTLPTPPQLPAGTPAPSGPIDFLVGRGAS
jgi:hypothetical protein